MELHQIQVTYQAEEDRILCRASFKEEDGGLQEVRAWLTRRMVKALWSTLIDAMDKEMVYVGPLKQGRFTTSYYLIFYNGTQHYVQKLMIIDQFHTVQAVFMGEASFGAGTANAQSVFCQLPRIENYMFYSGGSDNKTLYLYEHGPNRSSEYYSFESPIKTITASQNQLMGVFTNDQVMVGLENGDVYILGILSDEIADPARRLKKKIVLDKGVPVSSMYKMGFGFNQMM